MSVDDRLADPAPSLSKQRAALHECLTAVEHAQAAKVMRHLIFVHEELGRKGWHGVQALPSRVLGKALVQAEMLAGKTPSEGLATVLGNLRRLLASAELREEHLSRPRISVVKNLEVSEATHEEFEEMQRSWVGSVPRQDR